MRPRGFAALALCAAAFALSPRPALADPARTEAAGLDLAKYRGKVVLVDFWASWCGPCKLAFPFMDKLSHAYRASNVVVITINEERQRAAGEAFLRQVRSNLPVIWDSTGAIGKAWSVNDMPTTLLFDRSGKMRYRHQGFFIEKSSEYRTQLDALVKEH